MDDTIIRYIKGLPVKKRKQLVLLLKTLGDPNNDEKCLELEASGFDFDDLRKIQSNIFHMVLTESLIKQILLKL
jgi:hypothetical protein